MSSNTQNYLIFLLCLVVFVFVRTVFDKVQAPFLLVGLIPFLGVRGYVFRDLVFHYLEITLLFEQSNFVVLIFMDHVSLIVLVLSQGKQNHVPHVNPHLKLIFSTFFLIFPLMLQILFLPSKQFASTFPFPNIFSTCPYSYCCSLSRVIKSLF